jgi:peptidoglycan/xylan/chitin deacetylase (PgdA/CDA1 family)
MAASGIDFGAHTMTHANLERCDRPAADSELRQSRRIVGREVGREPLSFAYPYGKNTPAVRRLVKEAGFDAAFTTRSGLIRQGDDPLGLNRIDISYAVAPTVPVFACRTLQMHAY